jgi:hypothetical protein
MKDLYENALIGEFILRLGYKMGECGTLEHENLSLNLLQQTPLDSVWGDYMARKKTHGFLVEFKRDFTGRTTERKKLKYKLIQKSRRLQDLAGKCQLFGYSKQNPEKRGRTDVFFCRYLEALSDMNQKDIAQCEMSKFLDLILDDKIGGTAEDFTEYVTQTLDSLKKYYIAIPEEDKDERKNILAQIEAGDSAVAIISSEHAIITLPLTSMLPLDFIIRPKKQDEGSGSSDKSIDKSKSIEKSRDLFLGKEHGYDPHGPPLGYDQLRDRGREPPGRER